MNSHITSLLVLSILGANELSAQPITLLESSTHSSFATGLCRLSVLKTDQLIYDCGSEDLDASPFQYGLLNNVFADSALVVNRIYTAAFIDNNWGAEGFLDFSTDQVQADILTSINWVAAYNDYYVGSIGNTAAPFFDFPYNMEGSGLLLEQQPMTSMVAYAPSTGTLRPLFTFENAEGNSWTSIPAYLRRSTFAAPGTFNLQNAAQLNSTDVILHELRSSLQYINGAEQPIAFDPGYYLVKINTETGETISETFSNPGGILFMHALYKSPTANQFYALKTLRGGAGVFDASGNSFADIPSDSSYVTMITREDANGNALWATRLYDYNNDLPDVQNPVSMFRITSNLQSMGTSVFFSEYTDFTVNEGDVFYLNDMFGNNYQNTEHSSFDYGAPGLPAQRVGFARSKVYQLSSETGVPLAQIELAGKHVIRPGGNYYILQPSPILSFQEPKIFAVGDSIAWVHNIYAANDSVVQFIRRDDGGSQTFNVPIQPGNNCLVVWLNANLEVVNQWVIPSVHNGVGQSSTIHVTSISSYNQGTVLLAANIARNVSTSMDPAGIADVVDYPNQRSCFLGVYGVDDAMSVFDRNLSSKFINVFPNPSSGQIEFIVPDDFQAKDFRLFDSAGRMVESGLIAQNSGNRFALDFSYLNAGMYMLELGSQKEKLQSKVVIF